MTEIKNGLNNNYRFQENYQNQLILNQNDNDESNYQQSLPSNNNNEPFINNGNINNKNNQNMINQYNNIPNNDIQLNIRLSPPYMNDINYNQNINNNGPFYNPSYNSNNDNVRILIYCFGTSCGAIILFIIIIVLYIIIERPVV